MVIRAALASVIVLAMLSVAPPDADAAPGEPGPARCAAAMMIEMSAPSKDIADPGQFVEETDFWMALATVQDDGIHLFNRDVQALAVDKEARTQVVATCRKLDPYSRLPKMPKPPAGDTFACLKASSEALAPLQQAGEQMAKDPVLACESLDEARRILLDGRTALERGEVSCLADEYSTATAWASLSKSIFQIDMIRAGVAEACGKARTDRIASL